MNKKISIHAKVGYRVRKSHKLDEFGYLMGYDEPVALMDGDEVIMLAGLRSYEDYYYELVRSENEAAVLCEVFETVKGNVFAYWRDEEVDLDYLTKLEM